MNQCISVNGFSVKPVDPKFKKVGNSDFELHLRDSTIIKETTTVMPALDIKFNEISEVLSSPLGSFVSTFYKNSFLLNFIQKDDNS